MAPWAMEKSLRNCLSGRAGLVPGEGGRSRLDCCAGGAFLVGEHSRSDYWSARPTFCLGLPVSGPEGSLVLSGSQFSPLREHETAFERVPRLPRPPPQVFPIAPISVTHWTLSGSDWWILAVHSIHHHSLGPTWPGGVVCHSMFSEVRSIPHRWAIFS
ncbi:unnamed protein product [Arctogadus glacialis]